MAEPTLFDTIPLVKLLSPIPESRLAGVYGILHIASSRIYVGSSFNIRRRCGDHLRQLNHGDHRNRYLQSVWNKYGNDAFVFGVLQFCDCETLLEIESVWVRQLNSASRKHGFNLASDVRRNSGWHHSESTRRQMSASSRRLKPSPEHIETLRKKSIGNKHCLGKRNHALISKEQVAEAFRRRIAGERWTEIAKSLGVPFHCIHALRHTKGWSGDDYPVLLRELAERPQPCHGERGSTARLTDEQVREILNKSSSGIQCEELAKEYGVTSHCIRKIRTGKLWSHIEPPADYRLRSHTKKRKLNENDIAEIRRLYALGESSRELAASFNISHSFAKAVVARRSSFDIPAHLKRPRGRPKLAR